ncbi:hypothetical protein [Nocardia huaxiensis]|uniref:TetR family transcriptional regulator n=1 Tax=Nocardia huaxiensis TaxID=2755382 RepID=A0A7D6ZME8_9NOCA|nr:hypothetical protein [Nocardia huaxiensis]QLY29225.1 hypothetical protein H0264_28635 [Nocardia huaxiensis]UFS97274.1 hypothetical protein LPY97_04965 [Nocardia huaxiensis]
MRVLQEVIDEVDARIEAMEAEGRVLAVPRSKVLATVIYAVMASARSTGSYGSASLASAPLLDVILDGAEGSTWDTAVFTALLGSVALD